MNLEKCWNIGINLQKVDRLEVSNYLLSLKNSNLSIKEIQSVLLSYYKNNDDRQFEADLVSTRIVMELNENFELSRDEIFKIHYNLFNDIYDFAGKKRDYDIVKREGVLGGKSVNYVMHEDIFLLINSYINEFKSNELSFIDLVNFIKNIWEVHPFLEGNTRTTMVFILKYLISLGFEINDEVFVYSDELRDALAISVYKKDNRYLNSFIDKMIIRESNVLKRYIKS